MQTLSWQYPSWFLVFCVLLGVAAAIFLYRRDKTFIDQPPFLRYLMAILRGVVVTVLSCLLLSPLLKLMQTRTEPPVIILAQDQSTSIDAVLNKEDSSAYIQALNQAAEKLSAKYIVHKVGFGEEVLQVDQFVLNDRASDLGEFISYMDDQYQGQNVGAVLIASDGAINKGRNPLYLAERLNVPVSVLALGDTVRKTDLQVREVFHNSIAYMGDRFTVQADLSAVRLQGAKTALELKHMQGNQPVLLERIPIEINADPWFETKQFIIEAKNSGVQHYRLQLVQVNNEVTYTNNVKDFFVEVIDGRLKVLLLANSPHPDLATWKSALLMQQNYEVDISMASDFSQERLKDYDLVLLHQLPSSKYLLHSLLGEIKTQNKPTIFVTGIQTDLYAFNNAQNLLSVDFSGSRTPNEVTAIYNSAFNSFQVTDELKKSLDLFSPLVSPYGEYIAAPHAQILAYQRIGRVDTQFPLILMGEQDNRRIGIVAGEGIWKWQLYDQLQHGSKEIVHELLAQLTQYASTKSDRRKFRVTSAKKLFTELDNISFQAELYNDNYELINTPEVFFKIRNSEGVEFDYTFNPAGQAYTLDIGKFPEGEYTYQASTDLNGVRHKQDGKWIVQGVQLENIASHADHGLLRQLADLHDGAFMYQDGLDAWVDEILAKDSIKPVLYSTTQTRPLIHVKWLCFILIAGLCLEWFLRRYYGGY